MRPDDVAKHAGETLSRHASFVAQTLDAHVSTPFGDKRRERCDAKARMGPPRHSAKRFAFEVSNPFAFVEVCELSNDRTTRSPQIVGGHHLVPELSGHRACECGNPSWL
jgi:hypothetical protein